MTDREHLFQRICHEAVVACGADHAAIARYMREHIDALDATDRARVERDIHRVLAFRAPTPAVKAN